MEESAHSARQFDIFLSHSLKDAETILGIKKYFENKGFVVYVDWIVDNDLDRASVSAQTAERLRNRMKQSKAMIFAHSNNSPGSKWMPWELGFFDGHNGNISVLPIAQTETENFCGQEFIGLYPYIDTTSNVAWVNKGAANPSAMKKLR